MYGTLGTVTIIVWFFIFIAALALPLIVWRIKDLLLEIRDLLRAILKAQPGADRP